MKFCLLNKGDTVIYSDLRPNRMGLRKFTVKKINDRKDIYGGYHDYCRIWFVESDIIISVPPHVSYYKSKAHQFIVSCDPCKIRDIFQELGCRLRYLIILTKLKKSNLLREINIRTDNIIALKKQLETKPLLVVDKLCPGVDYYIGHFGSTKIIKAKVKAVKISAGWIQFDNDIFTSIPRYIEQEIWFSFHNRYISTNKNALIEFLVKKEEKKLGVVKRKYEASEYREIELSEISSEINNEYKEEFRN